MHEKSPKRYKILPEHGALASSAIISSALSKGFPPEILDTNAPQNCIFDGIAIDDPGTVRRDTYILADRTGDDGVVVANQIVDTSLIAELFPTETKSIILAGSNFENAGRIKRCISDAVIAACYTNGPIPTITTIFEVSKSGSLSDPTFRRTLTYPSIVTCDEMNKTLRLVDEDPYGHRQDSFPLVKLAQYLGQTVERRKNNSDQRRLLDLCCDKDHCANFIVKTVNKLTAGYFRETFEQEGIVELSKSTLRPNGPNLARPTIRLNSRDPKRLTQITSPLRNPAAFTNLANFNAVYFNGDPPLVSEQELAAILTA